MQDGGEDLGGEREEAGIINLPLYTERKADRIYRYPRRWLTAYADRMKVG